MIKLITISNKSIWPLLVFLILAIPIIAQSQNEVGIVKTGLTKTDTTFNFSIPGVESFALNDDGDLVITDATNEPHTIAVQSPLSTGEGSGVRPNEGNKVLVFPITVKDKDGNVYLVEKVPDPNNSTKEIAKATKLGSVSTPLPEGSFDPMQLNGDKAIVTFNKGNGKYAFDTWETYYDKISLIKGKYQKLFNNYYAPWKFLPSGESDEIAATIDIVDKNIDPTKVIFTTPLGTRYDAVYVNGSYTLRITAGPEGDVQELYALYPRGGDKYYTLGKLGIATYQHQVYKVVLVSVEGAVIDAGIEQKLKEIYDPVGVTWQITREQFAYSGNIRLMENSTGLSTYNEAMRALNEAYKTSHAYDKSANYLFFLKATGNTDINNRDLAGFMPRGSQYGYIFTSEVKDANEPITVAHELGHGRWKLYHPFDKHYGGFDEARQTNNLLAYGNGGHIAKWQWDQMNDPALVVSVFEGDEKSQMQTDPILAQIRKRIDELESATKLKHFTIIHCDACNSATQENTSELKISELLSVPLNAIYLESTISTIPSTKLTKIQFIERLGGKCLVLYYSHESGISTNVSGSDAFDLGSISTTTKKLYFLSSTNSINCSSFADSWSASICHLTSDNVFAESEQSKSYYTGLFDAIDNCLLSQSPANKILTVSEIESLLQKANSQMRSTQYLEFAQNGLIYRLDESGKAKLITDSPSNTSINAGDWSEANIEMKMRLGYNPEGILQFEALGIRKNLTIAPDKIADVVSVAQNMRRKNNALFLTAKIKDVETTAKVNPIIINNDEFPDRKKVQVDENASYFKIVCELGGVGITFLKTAKIEQPVYKEGEAYTVKAPPMATGIIESVGMVVTDITSAACTIHDLATDEDARKGAIQGLVLIKDQVVDDPTQLFPILTEVIVEEFTGSTPEEFTEANTATTDEGRKQHIVVKTSVRTASSVFASGKIVVKLPEMAQDVAFKMARSKSFLKFKKIPVPDEVLKNFEAKLKSLPDGGEKFLDDFKDVSDDVRKEVLDNTDLIDEWKEINEADPTSGGGKPEWLRRIQEGNQFNKQRAAFYPNNEIYLINPNNPKKYVRLDSYKPGQEIVSRKLTQFSDIQEETGLKYIQELKDKYAPNTKIADVASNKVGGTNSALQGQIGNGISGQMILEIPVQTSPIPKAILDRANLLGIDIRDIQGKIYNQ